MGLWRHVWSRMTNMTNMTNDSVRFWGGMEDENIKI